MLLCLAVGSNAFVHSISPNMFQVLSLTFAASFHFEFESTHITKVCQVVEGEIGILKFGRGF